MGRKKQPSYRVVVSDSKKDMQGPYKEAVGFYNPRSDPKEIRFDAERIKHWISQGAQASTTVHNLLIDQGVIEGTKIKATKTKKKKIEDKPADAEKLTEKTDEKPAEAVTEDKEQKPEEKPAEDVKANEQPVEDVKKEPTKEEKPEEAVKKEDEPKPDEAKSEDKSTEAQENKEKSE